MKIYITENTYITKTELNKVTRKALESNITDRTYVNDYVSEVNGNAFIWNYRKYDGIYTPTCKKDEADAIFVYNHGGTCIKEIRF